MNQEQLHDALQVEPVAQVELITAGGNAGIATRIVEIDSPYRERLLPGTKLYTHLSPRASVLDEREAFEAEMRCEEVWGHRSLVKRPDGRYQNWQVNAMWDVWQARAALAM